MDTITEVISIISTILIFICGCISGILITCNVKDKEIELLKRQLEQAMSQDIYFDTTGHRLFARRPIAEYRCDTPFDVTTASRCVKENNKSIYSKEECNCGNEITDTIPTLLKERLCRACIEKKLEMTVDTLKEIANKCKSAKTCTEGCLGYPLKDRFMCDYYVASKALERLEEKINE